MASNLRLNVCGSKKLYFFFLKIKLLDTIHEKRYNSARIKYRVDEFSSNKCYYPPLKCVQS